MDPIDEMFYGTTEKLDEDSMRAIEQERDARAIEIAQMEQEQQQVEEQEQSPEASPASPKPQAEATPEPEPEPEPKEDKGLLGQVLDSAKDTALNIGDPTRQVRELAVDGMRAAGIFGDTNTDALDVAKDFNELGAQGLVDWGTDLINKIPGVDIAKKPKLENDAAEAVRQMSAVIGPNIVLMGTGGAALKSLGAGGHIAFSNPLSRFVGGTALDIGIGAGVDYVAKSNEEDDNLAGTMKKMFPQTFGWISDDIATLDSDSPDIKRNKNLTEGAYLGLFTGFLEAGAQVFKALKTSMFDVRKATQWIPENEKAANYLNINQEVKGGDADEVLAVNQSKRDFALDEVGEYNLNNATNFDEPMLGVHDVYSGYESAVRTTDNLGIVGASIDQARIVDNVDTIYGRVGSVMSDGAIKYSLDGLDGGSAVIRGLADNLKEAGEYGYKTASGKYITHKRQMEVGEQLAADWAELDLADLKRAVGQEQSIGKYKTPELSDEGYAGVMKLIQKFNRDFADMDYYRASGLVAASMSGQVSDFAQSMRLMDETAVIERAQEMILDRVEFLMAQKGMTSYSAGRALNMLNIWNRAKRGVSGKTLEAEIAEEAAKSSEKMKKIAIEAKEAVKTMRNISRERPEMLKPFMLAYDLTDGDINSMTKLNNYVRQSTGIINKAFFDGQTEIPSAFMNAAWANVYNSALSSVVTPIKAVTGNTLGLIERPIATMAGAALHWDWDTVQRGVYQYSAIGDSLLKGWTVMKRHWGKAVTDPTGANRVVRTDYQNKNFENLEILNTFADAKADAGEYGPQAIMSQINAMEDMSQSPWFKFGINAMSAFDGFTQAMIGNAEARGRAFDAWKAGALDGGKGMRDEIAQNVYDQMWDADGYMTDAAAKAASGEIALNLDSKSVDALSGLLKRAPVLKPFMLFPKTSVNDLKWAGSHNPLGIFIEQLNAFGKPFKQQPIEKVEELLTARGLPFDENAEAVYNSIRAELKGRKAIGSLAVFAAGTLFLTGGLRGNGHYDKERQKLRNDAGWKPRTVNIPGTDKWISYENLGAVSTWLAFVADIGDNMDTLDPSDMATMFNKAGYLLSSNLTNKSFLAGLEPMNDIFSGNPAALARWTSSFGSATFPLSGLRNDFSRVLAPQMKEVEQELLSLLANRNPVAKNTLPDKYDWIDGGIVGEPENPLERVWNTFSPWKISNAPSARKDFLMEIEFDARPSLRTNGKGVEYTPEERSQVTSQMGQDQNFGKALDRIMQTTEAKEFRRRYRKAQSMGIAVDREVLDNLHRMVERELRSAQQAAETQIQARDEIANKQYYNSTVDKYVQRGDLEGAQDFMSQYPQYQYLR